MAEAAAMDTNGDGFLSREEWDAAWNKAAKTLGDEASIAFHQYPFKRGHEKEMMQLLKELGMEKDVLFKKDHLAVPYPCPAAFTESNMTTFPKEWPWAADVQVIKNMARALACKLVLLTTTKVDKVSGPRRDFPFTAKNGWKVMPTRAPRKPKK